MRPLVIVRPEPGATATAEAARKLGLETIVMPLFSIEPVPWEVPSEREYAGVLLTSANALRYGGMRLAELRHLPAFCVGEATAKAASEAGFEIAKAGDGGIDALLESVPLDLRLLHLCGADRRRPASAGLSVDQVAVYRSAEIAPPPNFRKIEGAVVAVHSPRAGSTVARYVAAADLDRGLIAIAAISSAAAEAAGSGWDSVGLAESPADAALLAIAARLCKNQT